MDRLRALEIFVEIVDRGGMSRAAESLGMSPTTVSSYLADLETRIGRRLLDRSTRRIDLTREGRRFLDDARHILDAFNAAEDFAQSAARTPRGRVRIDAPASVGHRYLLPALPRFRAHYPDIAVDLSLGDRASIFRPDGFDVLVRVGEGYLGEADVRLLGHTRFVHVASRSYLERRGTPETPQDLEAHDCITYSSVEQPGGRTWSFQRDGVTHRVRASSKLSFNDGAAMATAAAAGLGIARTLELLVADEVADSRLVSVLDGWSDQAIPIYAFAAVDRSKMPAIAASLDFLESLDWNRHYPGGARGGALEAERSDAAASGRV